MSLTKEDLQAIAELIDPVKQDVQNMKQDMLDMKQDMQGMKQDMQGMKRDMSDMKQSLQQVEQRTMNIELKLENVTNHNIELLAENQMKLVDKLNQAIRVSDKTLLYEVQVSTLQSKMERLEEEVKELKRTYSRSGSTQ